MKLADIRPQHLNAYYKSLAEPGTNRWEPRAALHVPFDSLGLSQAELARRSGLSIATIAAQGRVLPGSIPAEKLVCNGLVVLQLAAAAGHIGNLAAVDQAVKVGGGNGSAAEAVGPLVKAFVGSNNEASSLAHGGNKAKEKIGLGGREGPEAHLVHHHEGSFVEILETACWRWRFRQS